MAKCNLLTCVFPCCFGQLRYVMVAIAFFSIIVTHCQRAVLSIAIVEMVGLKEPPRSTCPLPDSSQPHTIQEIKGGKVDWNERQQSLNLASFYIGYFLIHIPAGILCDMYGARHVLIWGVFISTVCTCLIPAATIYLEWWSVLILRILTGIAQSVQYPCLSSLIGRWIPTTERASVGAIIFASNSIGYVVGNVGTGLMIKYTVDWTLTYYVWTGCGMLFIIVAFMYLYSDPRTHPYLSPMELHFIQDMIILQQPMRIPVKGILKDPVIYGLVLGQIGHDLITFTLANNLPKYLNNVLGFDIESNALFSFIFLIQWISSFMFGKLADYVIGRNANICLIRKLYSCISIMLPSVAMIGVGMVECDRMLVLILLMITMFGNGLYYCGMKIHILDISINMAGLMMAIVNGCGSISGFFCSYLIGLVAKKNSHGEWKLIFGIMFIIHVITTFGYYVMTSCDRRKWDYRPDEEQVPKRKAKKFYLELSESAYLMKREKEKMARQAHKEADANARRLMKEAALEHRV